MDSNKLSVIILSAGKNVRLCSKTPKPLFKISGKSCLERLFDTVSKLDPTSIIVVLKHEKEKIIEEIKAIASKNANYPDIHWVLQDDNQGTAAATNSALQYISTQKNGELLFSKGSKKDITTTENVLILAADAPLIKAETLQNIVDEQIKNKNAMTILSTELDNPFGYGRIIRDKKNRPIKITEQKHLTEEEKNIKEVGVSTYAFNYNKLVEGINNAFQIGSGKAKKGDYARPEFYLTDSVEYFSENKEPVGIYCESDNDSLESFNDKLQYCNIQKKYYKKTAVELVKKGAIITDLDQTYIEDTVEVGCDTIIYPMTELKGETKIGEDCIIGPSTTIIDSNVEDGAQVVKSHVIKSQIGKNANIGPYTHLREKTIVKDSTKVGSYSETKNITLGEGSKIPHLSYVGDAEIGKNTNIGAGTIFANYDGVNKHKSTVGDNVKIGSDSVLVAPVNVGDNVYSGAGSVIRKDVEKGSLVYSENSQKEEKKWFDKNRG